MKSMFDLELEKAGLKKTEARLALLALLDTENNPLDVLSIVSGIRSEGIAVDQVTVYRILEILTQKGIINRLEFGEGKYRYELQKDDHHHLICQNCGSITDIEDKYMEEFEKEIENKKKFIVKSHSLEFFGVCLKCQQ